jgi:DNA (cytosine-5)-methyltransferase 1
MKNVKQLSGAPAFPVVSLFSGAMGLDLGLAAAGLNVSVSQDMDKWCVQTALTNDHNSILGDIRALIETDPSCGFLLNPAKLDVGDVFAVVGGPPCQSFSTAGKRLGIEDARGTLYEQFIYVVRTIKPRFFIMENVKGLASMPAPDGFSGTLLSVIVEKFRALGYHTVFGVLDAVHYGAPQFRERLVIIGSRDNEAIFLPSATHFHMHQNPEMRWQTLGSAIFNLMDDPGVCAKFSPNIAKYLGMVPEGGNWRSLPQQYVEAAMGGAYESGGGKVGFFRRLAFWEPSPTLVTSPIQKATLLCHPRDTRPLSVKEYARIQGFPDDWRFIGSSTEAYRQIGNAVPVPLGRALGQMLMSVALGDSEVRVKRMRGTSVHDNMRQMSLSLTNRAMS